MRLTSSDSLKLLFKRRDLLSQVDIGFADEMIKEFDVAIRLRVDVSLSDASTFFECTADTTLSTVPSSTIAAVEEGITVGLKTKDEPIEAGSIKHTDEVAIQLEVV